MTAGWIVIAVCVVVFALWLGRMAKHEHGDRIAQAHFNAHPDEWDGGSS